MNAHEKQALRSMMREYGPIAVLEQMQRIAAADGQNPQLAPNRRTDWRQAAMALEHSLDVYRQRINGRNALGRPFEAVEVDADNYAELLERYRTEGLEAADEAALFQFASTRSLHRYFTQDERNRLDALRARGTVK